MSLTTYDDLNEMQMDVLREIGNIGSGNAATSLSAMLCKPVSIDVPVIKILDHQTASHMLGGPENVVVGLLLSLTGEVTGMMMFLLERDFAHLILNTLLGQDLHSFSDVDDMGISALMEISNIMAASYVNSIAQLTGMMIDISVPDICIDMVGAMLSVPMIHYANVSDKVIFIEDKFRSEDKNAVSHILLMPEVESLTAIMNKLGLSI
ncbi:MAG: chemotaxis protein CheC [Angelakisella sp.]